MLGAMRIVIGVMTGLPGVGGGFVIEPLVRRFIALSMKRIDATSLVEIALIGTAGLVNAALHGRKLPLSTRLQFYWLR